MDELTTRDLSHPGVVVDVGMDSNRRVAEAVRRDHLLARLGGAPDVVAHTVEEARQLLQKTVSTIAFVGHLDDDAYDVLSAAVVTGRRVYVATSMPFDRVRGRFRDVLVSQYGWDTYAPVVPMD